MQAYTQQTGLSSVTHKSIVITFLNGPFLQIERKICDMNFFLSIVSIELRAIGESCFLFTEALSSSVVGTHIQYRADKSLAVATAAISPNNRTYNRI